MDLQVNLAVSRPGRCCKGYVPNSSCTHYSRSSNCLRVDLVTLREQQFCESMHTRKVFDSRMKIAMIGLGYIGLPTALAFAETGIEVTGVDNAPDKIESLINGTSKSTEPGLLPMVQRNLERSNLKLSTVVPTADVYIVAVPTPINPDKSIDISFLKTAIRDIAPSLKPGCLVIIESTISPGTTAKMGDVLQELRPDLTVDTGREKTPNEPVFLAHCPERILPGHALEELKTNDRIIGGLSPRAGELAIEVYSRICDGDLVETDALTAEMSKITENAFRDVNIAFANELSMISESLGVDVWELISLANRHPRVDILEPGTGVGGHCIAIDPWFLVEASPRDAKLIRTARLVNDSKPAWVAGKILQMLPTVDNPAIAIFGLTFKADIDDTRESPSMKVIQDILLRSSTAEIFVIDPFVIETPPELNSTRVQLLKDIEDHYVDVAAILVNHTAFKDLELSRNAAAILDLRPSSG